MNKKQYVAPTLTVVEFKTERGYASSGPLSMVVLAQFLGTFSAQGMELWEEPSNPLFGDSWDQ